MAILLSAGTITRCNEKGEVESFEVEEDTMAGTIGLCDANATHSMAEVAHILLFPRFQRTFIATNANWVMLRYLLDPIEKGGLGLRRVQWQANVENEASIKAAKRLGFKMEGVARWQRVLGEEKEGMTPAGLPRVDVEGRRMGPGRHSAMLALCWDDWIEYGRNQVEGLVNR